MKAKLNLTIGTILIILLMEINCNKYKTHLGQNNYDENNHKTTCKLLNLFDITSFKYYNIGDPNLIPFLLELLGFGAGHMYLENYECFAIKFGFYLYLVLIVFLYPFLVLRLNETECCGKYLINTLTIIFGLIVFFILGCSIYDLMKMSE